MSKRDARRRMGLPTVEENDGGLSLDELARAGYGMMENLGDTRIVAKARSIFDIVPDPAQPRRAVPSTVRNSAPLTGGANGFAEMFDQWAGLAFREGAGHAARDVNQAHALYKSLALGEVDDKWPEKPGPIENSFLAVVALAASIRRDGLTNPVTVTPASGGYMILTGERRWLAYQLLYLYEGEAWLKIPAREVDRDVWAQATENNQRNDLNAISRARQYAILLMDLLTQEGEHFRPFEAFRHEQDFYAQVADSKAYRVPRGKNDQLLNAMGVKGVNSLSQYRSLLSLPREYWEQGDDENWSNTDLIRIVHSMNNSPDEGDEEIVRSSDNSAADPGRNLSEYWEDVKQNPPPASTPPVSQISQPASPARPAPPASSTPPAAKPAPQSAPPPPAHTPWWGVGKTVIVMKKDKIGQVGQVIQIVTASQVRVNTGRSSGNFDRSEIRPYDRFISIVDNVYQWQTSNGAWCPQGMTDGNDQELVDLVELGWLQTAFMRVSPTGSMVPHYGTTASGCQQLGVPEITAPDPEPPVEAVSNPEDAPLVSVQEAQQLLDDLYAMIETANQLSNLTPPQLGALAELADRHIRFCEWLRSTVETIQGGA